MHNHRRIALLMAWLLGCASFALADDATTISYPLRYRSAEEIGRAIRPLVEGTPGIQVRVNPNDDRVTLTGPPWAHELAETVLQRMDQPRADVPNSAPPVTPTTAAPGEPTPPPRQATGVAATPAAVPAVSDQPPANAARPAAANTATAALSSPRGMTRQIIPLAPNAYDSVRQQLAGLLDRESSPTSAETAAWTLTTPGGTLRVECDRQRSDVYLEGPAALVEQANRLIVAMTSPRLAQRPTVGQTVVRLDRKVQPGLQSMLQSSRYGESARFGGTVGIRDAVQVGPFRFASGPPQTPAAEPLPPPADADPQAAPAQPLAPESQPPSAPMPRDPAASAPAASGDVTLPQLEGVEIETLPDLDAIILRGRNQDIDQLADIIRQLEMLSRQTQPTIEIVSLRHTASAAIAEVIEQTQENLIGTRQGRAQVIPLGKPNALLLIGWGEAVKALQELAEKLDQPVQPDTQFRVFRLRHATATTLQESLQTFFDNRPAELSPTILSTVDQRTNSLVVHAAPRDLEEIARLIETLDVAQGEAVHQTRVFEIHNSLADDIAETLEAAVADPGTGRGLAMELLVEEGTQTERIVSGILEDIKITVNPRKNNLIVSAPAASFPLIEALIRQLDSEGTIAKIKIFPIQNGDAASLVETLRALIPSQTGTAAPTVQLSAAPGGTALVPLRFTVDVRSNSIIATGSEADLKIVDALVLRLDESDAMQRKNTVYQLKNSPAVDVALAINEFLRNTRQVESAGPGAANPFEQLEKEVVVVPEPVSNKLVLSATPRYFEEIRALIEKLDEQPPQVMIQVLIAEVTLGNAEEFGVEVGLQDSVLFDRSLLGDLVTLTQTTQTSTPAGILTETDEIIAGATNTPGFNWNNSPLGNSGSEQAIAGSRNVGGQGLSSFDVGRVNSELGFGGLVLAASSANVSFLLRALEESRRMQVLSRPQILTLDNQPAFIQVGQRVPRIVGSSLNQIGQQNQIELENVGLILGVTPRISPEGNVVMEIDAEKSAVGPESEGIPVSVSAEGTVIRSPRVDVTSAQATVSAADGETIILGGLITNSQREIHRKVPLLGDIPLLKYLFRFDSYVDRRTELLIILTPRIVRSAEDADRLKQVELARMNWCAADVVELHGDVFSNYGWHDGVHGEEAYEVIFPHDDPRGERRHLTEPSVLSDPGVLTEPLLLEQPLNDSPVDTPLVPEPVVAPPPEPRSPFTSARPKKSATPARPVGGGLSRMFGGGKK